MKEKYLKCLMVLVIVIILGGLFIYQNINKENKPLPEVKLKEIVNKDKSFAIMIQSKNGYKEYDSDTWPGNGYKFKEAKCIDSKGDEIKEAVTYEEGKITLTTNNTIFCTIYFDYKGTIEILKETDSNKNLSTDIQGGMYRYQGTDDVHNWICFGTTDNCGTNDDNIDKYMYRIIGITPEGQLYLIKETFLKEGTTTKFVWHSKDPLSDCLEDKCEWSNVDLYKRLNGLSNGNQKGAVGNTDIFVNSSEYDYLKSRDNDGISGSDTESEWYKLIAEHNWMYGDTNETKYNGDYMYAIETGNTATKRYWSDEEQGQTTCSDDNPCIEKNYTWSKSISAKIGLMYMHDVAYAYADCGNGECNERGNPRSSSNAIDSWIHFQKDGYNISSSDEWLTTRLGVGSMSAKYVGARDVGTNGYMSTGTLNASNLGNPYGVRPVFYLNSSIKIASGSGTKTDPYILEI